MSYRILDTMQDFTDRETGVRSMMCEIIADTAADLPANTAQRIFIIGTFATVIDTGYQYKIDSGGNWILQPSTNAFDNVYTRSETDAQMQIIDNAIIDIANDGSKNKLPNNANTTGIFTVNADGSVIATVPANNSQTSLTLFTSDSDISFDTDMILSGAPVGGSYPYRWAIYLLDANGNLVFVGSDGMADEGETRVIPAGTVFRSVRILIRANIGAQTLTFLPMICDKDLYGISPEYTKYAPSNRALYDTQKQLIQGLKFTPETSTPTNSQRLKFSSPNSNNTVTMLIGKLNSTTNYVQFYVNDVDKGYITFSVSRNIDTWQ